MASRDGTPAGTGSRLQRWLIEASPTVRSLEERARVRLLAILALAGFVAAILIDVAFLLADRHYAVPWYIHGMLALGYALSRTGHRRAGALALVYTPALSACVRVATGVAFSPIIPLTNFVMPPLVAAILLSRGDLIVLLAVEMVLAPALVLLFPQSFPDPTLVVYPMVLTAFVGVLVVAFIRQRDRLEQIRQQDLRDREEHLRALVASVPGAVYRATRSDGRRVRDVSPGIRDLAGYEPNALVASDAPSLDDLIHPEDRARVVEERTQGLAQGRSFAIEYRLLRPDGGFCWVLDRGQQVRDARETTESIDGALIDVTQRRAAMEETERLVAIAEATSDFVSTALPDGRVRYLNRAGRRLLGWDDEVDVTASQIADTHPRWALEIVEKEGIPTAMRDGHWRGETALLGPDGREIPVSQVIMAHRAPTGEVAFLSTIMRDLSERIAAEEARRESEERFRLLAGAAFEGIAVTAQGVLVDANEQLAAMLGLARDELVGRRVVDFVAPESLEEVMGHIRDDNEGPYEHLARRADGSVFPVEVRARTIFLGGRPQRVTALRDLTERKRMEDERAALERRTQHGQKLESLGVLAGGIAHDFNNLLAAMLGNLDLASVGLDPNAPQRRFLTQAAHAAQQGAALARELLAYSGRGRFEVSRLDLSELVESMAQLLRAAIHKTIHLELRLERDLPAVTGDVSQLQQVIMNVIVNAADAIGERPGTILLRTATEECDRTFLGHSRLPVKPEPGRFVLVEVLDDGCGMAEEVLERLFDPFFSTKLAGRGLGMAAVQGIVQGHGGAIMVESSPGRGTTFRIYFPVAPDVEAVVDGAEPPREETKRPVRRRVEPGGLVLVVDDEEIVRITAQEMLEHLGFSVVTAGDGREALELFRRMAKQVTLVVLDLTMPTMDGIETLAELRKLRPDLRVLLASGFDETEISERCIDERPDGFLQKPYWLSTLQEAIEKALLG